MQLFLLNVKQLINDIGHYHVVPLNSFSWTTHATNSPQSLESIQDVAVEPESTMPEPSVVQALASALMSWSLDPSLDRICIEKLGLRRPNGNISFGLRG
jgi:hypothetical protein